MKVGDMVKASYSRPTKPGMTHSGIIVSIEESTDVFSEKYAIEDMAETYVKVLTSGMILTFLAGEDLIEVISD